MYHNGVSVGSVALPVYPARLGDEVSESEVLWYPRDKEEPSSWHHLLRQLNTKYQAFTISFFISATKSVSTP